MGCHCPGLNSLPRPALPCRCSGPALPFPAPHLPTWPQFAQALAPSPLPACSSRLCLPRSSPARLPTCPLSGLSCCPCACLLACSYTTDKDGVVEVLRTLPSQLGLEVNRCCCCCCWLASSATPATAMPPPHTCRCCGRVPAARLHPASLFKRCRRPSHPFFQPGSVLGGCRACQFMWAACLRAPPLP